MLVPLQGVLRLSSCLATLVKDVGPHTPTLHAVLEEAHNVRDALADFNTGGDSDHKRIEQDQDFVKAKRSYGVPINNFE